ncbi:MAG: DUF4239 domain-containing protein [Candidatus Obscuribacterales bacterium]|nr:DUF4239 domain-containing protein [Candidatus Obscuribacterales bacterium]
MNTIPGAIALIVGFVAFALLGQLAVNKFTKIEDLEEHHSAGEAMMGVVGTLFSVLLGFMIAGAMQQYDDERMYGTDEASNVADVFRIARGMSDIDRPRIRELCRDYVTDVIDVEWPQMEKREPINHGWEIYQELWESVVATVPENDRQSNLQQCLVDSMRSLGENRRARVLLAQKEMPAAMWLVIGAGALTTMSLSYIFASRFPKIQGIMTTIVATAIALNIWLLAAYSSPYSGELKLQPAMFQMVKSSVMKVSDSPSRFLHDK